MLAPKGADLTWKVWARRPFLSSQMDQGAKALAWVHQHTQSTRAVVDTFVRTKFLQLYSRQGTVQAYRAYKNRPSPKLT